MHLSSNGGQHITKKVQKNRNNYASVECGAKILAANPEAKVITPNNAIVYIFRKLLNVGSFVSLTAIRFEIFYGTNKFNFRSTL